VSEKKAQLQKLSYDLAAVLNEHMWNLLDDFLHSEELDSDMRAKIGSITESLNGCRRQLNSLGNEIYKELNPPKDFKIPCFFHENSECFCVKITEVEQDRSET
jgi:hypothetical protein